MVERDERSQEEIRHEALEEMRKDAQAAQERGESKFDWEVGDLEIEDPEEEPVAAEQGQNGD